MNKKIVKESVGRDLVGASNYASRSSVVHKILLKYPDPKSLSVALAQMSKDSTDPRVQKKCAELATKCQGVDIQQYPKFVQNVAGLSKLWSVAAKTIGAAAAGAGTYYLVKTMSDVAGTDEVKNAQGVGDKAQALLKGTGEKISSDVGALKDNAIQNYDNIKKWGANKAKEAATAVSKKADELSGAKADRASIKNAARQETIERRSADAAEAGARSAADKAVAKKAAADTAAEMNARKAAIAAEAGARKSADDAATADRAAIRKDTTQGFEKARRRMNSLQPKVEPKSASVSVSDITPSKEDLKQAYSDAYGPTIKKAKELGSAAYDKTRETTKRWLDRLGGQSPAGIPNAFGVPALYR